MNTKFMKVTLLVLSLFMLFPGFAGAAGPEKIIAVAPFNIQSQEPLSFLEKGIVRMLETRLKIPGHSFAVVAPAGQDLTTLNADYIIQGTVLVFGDSVSTDATLTGADSGKVELSFSQFGKEKGEVLNHIDLFAEQIRTQVLHLEPAPRFRQMSGGATGYGPGAYVETRKPEIWRSTPFDSEIRGIAVADIDNDSKNETIILSRDSLQVFRRTKETLEKLSEMPLDFRTTRHLFVDVIDLDRDGKKEIFVTSVNDDSLRPDSSLYRWESTGLVKVSDGLHWILRTVDTKDGRILLGQAPKGAGDKRLKTGIFRMDLDTTGTLSPSALSYPFADTPMGMAFGDFLNNGQETIALLDLDGHISIYSADGTRLYKSSEEYGGSAAYIEFKGARYNQADGFQKGRIYLQQRLFAADLYDAGKTSLITVKNNDVTKGLLARLRHYDKGYFESLASNEMGMTPEGRTQRVSGYIPDFTIADMDNDGKKELVFALVNSDDMFKKKVSRVITQSFIVKGLAQPF